MSDFDYYSSAPSLADMSKWIVFLRAYALVRTPACIYSAIETPSSHKIYRKICSVPVPDYVSNFLADEVALHNLDAREADFQEGSSVSDQIKVSPRPDSLFKPRRCDGYYVSRASVLRLGVGLCARACHVVGRASAGEALGRRAVGIMERLVAERYNGLARRAMPMPAPLWRDEMEWVQRTVTGPVWVPEIEV